MNPPGTEIPAHGPVPVWYRALAWLMPVGVLAQFVSAGVGLFAAPDAIGMHAGLGIALSVPALALAGGALAAARLRRLARPAGAVLVLYLVQVGLAGSGAPIPLSLHPANGALLFGASLLHLARTQRLSSRVAHEFP